MTAATSRINWSRFLRLARPEAGRLVLDRRRIYVLPTRMGLVFALVLLAMLIGATNYGNSLVFALTFVLGSVGFVSMLYTYRNLAGLTIATASAASVFAGQPARFPLVLGSVSPSRRRYAIAVELPPHQPVLADLPIEGSTRSELMLPTPRRGRLRLPRLTLFTRYPLGLFHAWAYAEPQEECIVYPTPSAEADLPPLSGQGASHQGSEGRGGDDFLALRPYHPGDSLRQVHWKALAHGGGLVVKQFGGEAGEELWLNWNDAPEPDIEGRLSRLCRWVLEAEAMGLRYGLQLPSARIELNHGTAHRDRCLTALALFGEAS